MAPDIQTVVRDQDLEIREGLRQKTGEALGQVVTVIVIRDQNTEPGGRHDRDSDQFIREFRVMKSEPSL